MSDPILGGGMFQWLHSTRLGRRITENLASWRFISACFGWGMERQASRLLIPRFAKKMGVPLDELEKGLDEYETLSEFFSRRIDLSKRPIDGDPNACVCPADGRVLVLPTVTADQRLVIKGSAFDLGGILGDAALTRRFTGGAAAIVRLYVADYHHFHFPVAGIPSPAQAAGHRYYAVTPHARDWNPPFFSENYRMLTRVASDVIGTYMMIEIGAFAVGSIRQAFQPGTRVEKGAHKGYFRLGGSTVLLLFEPGVIRFEDDLVTHSADRIECYLRFGERLGYRP